MTRAGRERAILDAVERERVETQQDLVRALRQHPLCQRMIIIGMAEYAMPADRTAALTAGCNDFLTKPLRYQAVEDAITQALSGSRR